MPCIKLPSIQSRAQAGSSNQFKCCGTKPRPSLIYCLNRMRQQIRACAGPSDREAKVAQEDFLDKDSYRAIDEELWNEAVTSAASSPDSDVWASKPPWCQPWTIVLTGAVAVSAVWKLSDGNLLFSAVVAVPVAIWWYLFLGVMPQAYREYVQSLPSRQP